MDILSKFAERLAGLICDATITPELLAKSISHNTFDIYHWLSKNNKYMPSVVNLIKLANYFSCSISFIIGFEDENSLTKPNLILPKFSERFLAVIKERQTNIYRLGKQTCTSTTTYYRWINEKAVPTIDSLIKISKALEVSIDYLVGRED